MKKDNKRKALLITSFLLQYPDERWYKVLQEVKEEVKAMDEEASTGSVLSFLEYAERRNELDLAETYVDTFDFSKSTSLYLTYYNFKEQRERGTALVNLKHKYEEAGLLMSDDELPDFLPVVLEFSAVSSQEDILMDHFAVIQEIFNRLYKDNNPYMHVFDAILSVLKSSNQPDMAMVSSLMGGGAQ